MKKNIRIISAGAGSGKTFRLTNELVALLQPDSEHKVRATGTIATTFTNKAAAELQERVRVKLLEEGLTEQADQVSNALIGTVHSLGIKLLKRFAFEAGVSPQVSVIPEEETQQIFNNSLANILTIERIEEMEKLAERLGLYKKERKDWRAFVKQITVKARENNFSVDRIRESRDRSIASFCAFLPEAEVETQKALNERFGELLNTTIQNLEQNETDSTKKTQTGIRKLKAVKNRLKWTNHINWYDWADLSKMSVAKKSEELFLDFKEFAVKHDSNPAFRNDISTFISHCFDLSILAIEEYQAYKQRRGLIDYADMESLILTLIKHPQVEQVLRDEIDLLLVDEFQDTSPMQLEIFLKLSDFAKISIWVGDPKQSIYGFRGSEPELMMGIVKALGGVKPEDIQQNSWRSREDLVNMVNSIFTKSFTDFPPEQVRLFAKRTKLDHPNDPNFKAEPIEMDTAIKHWNFRMDEGGRDNASWFNQCVAEQLRIWLEIGVYILPKGEQKCRKAQPGDVAILCRSNKACLDIATVLNKAGLSAAMGQGGLLKTIEIKMILACMKFILNPSDSLSTAEILLLLEEKPLHQIVESRIDFLKEQENAETTTKKRWAIEYQLLELLAKIRKTTRELSGTEILNLVIEELDIRRRAATWGNEQQRLDNIDALRKLALEYEGNCNRLHDPASLGGLLLWLNNLERNQGDRQGAGTGQHAVNVLTYHKSKGLEWPIVVPLNLENTLRDDCWGVKIIRDNKQINIEEPLGGSWLRFWINPYADQQKNTPLIERINASPEKEASTATNLDEEKRILYVGFTRARDYLIIPSRSTSLKWLNRVCNEGDEGKQVLNVADPDSPWVWEGSPVPLHQQQLNMPKHFPVTIQEEQPIPFQEERSGRQKHQSLFINEAEQAKDLVDIKLLDSKSYADPLVLESIEAEDLQHLMAGAITILGSGSSAATNRLSQLFDEAITESSEATNYSDRASVFYQYITKEFKPDNVQTNLQIITSLEEQIIKANADLLLHNNSDLNIVIHSVFEGKAKQQIKELKDNSNVFLALKKAYPNAKVFVNYWRSGVLTEVNIQLKAKQMNLL